MIKTFEQYNEMDPYGEENWDNPHFDIGDLVVAKRSKIKRGGEITIIEGNTYKIRDVCGGTVNGVDVNFYLMIDPDTLDFVEFMVEDKMGEYFDKK